MNIYFAGSITGGRQDKDLYAKIIPILSKYGTVLTEHVGNVSLSAMGEATFPEEYVEVYKRDMAWLEKSDVVVAEVTAPSLGVGYELGRAEALGKRTLCLYRPAPDRRLSSMVRGNRTLTIKEYNEIEELEPILRAFFKTL